MRSHCEDGDGDGDGTGTETLASTHVMVQLHVQQVRQGWALLHTALTEYLDDYHLENFDHLQTGRFLRDHENGSTGSTELHPHALLHTVVPKGKQRIALGIYVVVVYLVYLVYPIQ